MSNVYGAGSPAAGLNAPGGMPPWLMNMWNYVNPMAQATAGAVDDQGRPQTPIAGAQQALAANAAGGLSDSLTARPAPPAMMAFMRGGGGSGGGGGANGTWPDQGIVARMNDMNRVLPVGGGVGQGPFAGRPIAAPPSGIGQGPFAGRPATGAPSATPPVGRPAPAKVAATAPVVPQVPWITPLNDRPNLPAGNGPLGRNAQTKMGMLDFSKLFNRTG